MLINVIKEGHLREARNISIFSTKSSFVNCKFSV